jgi:hypothetical protein
MTERPEVPMIHITRSTHPNAERIEIVILGDDANVRALTGAAIIKAVESVVTSGNMGFAICRI